MSKRHQTQLRAVTCRWCGWQFEWLTWPAGPAPSTCSGGCFEALRRQKAGELGCITCKERPEFERGLCHVCLVPVRKLVKRHGWPKVVADGLALPAKGRKRTGFAIQHQREWDQINPKGKRECT